MPWHVGEQGSHGCDGYPVVKDGTDEVEGCHDTREQANRQVAALYANEPEMRAQLKAATINDLPDSAFAYIEPGGSKDDQGKTVPRSKRHFPIHDAAHVRNALARAPQSPFGAKAMPKIRAAARKFDIHVADERSQPLLDDLPAVPGEILERSDAAVLADSVDFPQRIVDVIAVPYEQEAEITWRGETWREVFSRSAFNGIEDHAGRVPVNREHRVGDTVGKIVKLDPHDPRGLLASVKIARTLRGDDTLQLASEGMLGASVGYFVKKGSDVDTNRRIMMRRVNRAFLAHLAMVESPAYVGAETVAVREGLLTPPAAGEPLVTPALDEIMADEVFAWAKNHVPRN